MKSALLTACFGFWALIAQAGNGTWTNLNGGSWTNAANWSGGTIADASGSTANFSTLNLPADATVTLDTARTIGNLTFDDQNSTKHNWFLNAGGAGALTLAGTTPTITVSSATTTIALPLAGTASLTKLGSGALVFPVTNALNTLGLLTNGAGDLSVTTLTFSNTRRLAINNAAATFTSSGTISLPAPSGTDTNYISGAGTWRLRGTNSSLSNPDIIYSPTGTGSANGAQISSALDIGPAGMTRYIEGYANNNRFYSYWGDLQIGRNTSTITGGSLTGAGNLYFYGYPSSSWEMAFVLFTNNSAFTGNVTVQRGDLVLYNGSALTATNNVLLNPNSGENAYLHPWATGFTNVNIGTLASSGTGNAQVIGHYNQSLTINENTDTTFAGKIINENGILSIIKNGTGKLTLTGANTYSGTTTLNAGTLQVDGSLSVGAATVKTGSTLSGNGAINGPVTVLNGGTLSPGDSGIGTLTVNNTLTLSGSTLTHISQINFTSRS